MGGQAGLQHRADKTESTSWAGKAQPGQIEQGQAGSKRAEPGWARRQAVLTSRADQDRTWHSRAGQGQAKRDQADRPMPAKVNQGRQSRAKQDQANRAKPAKVKQGRGRAETWPGKLKQG